MHSQWDVFKVFSGFIIWRKTQYYSYQANWYIRENVNHINWLFHNHIFSEDSIIWWFSKYKEKYYEQYYLNYAVSNSFLLHCIIGFQFIYHLFRIGLVSFSCYPNGGCYPLVALNLNIRNTTFHFIQIVGVTFSDCLLALVEMSI